MLASQSLLRATKQCMAQFFQHAFRERTPASALSLLEDEVSWWASHPINEVKGPTAVLENWLNPLLHAFPDIDRREDIVLTGYWDGALCGGEGYWLSTTGHYVGTFQHSLWGVPATGHLARLRFGEFYRVVHGKIVEARILVDLIDLALQAGLRALPPSPGIEHFAPPPREQDGLLWADTDPAQAHASMDAVMAMIGGLKKFNQTSLQSMGMEQFWDPDMMWYGPCGIGAMRAVKGFQTYHQGPFLHAFPDRVGGNHRARIAEGRYVASTGWPSVRATHLGEYLGVAATGRAIEMRVMDWWRRGDRGLSENWVFIDLPHLFLQMDVDLLGRLPKAT